MGGKKIGVK